MPRPPTVAPVVRTVPARWIASHAGPAYLRHRTKRLPWTSSTTTTMRTQLRRPPIRPRILPYWTSRCATQCSRMWYTSRRSWSSFGGSCRRYVLGLKCEMLLILCTDVVCSRRLHRFSERWYWFGSVHQLRHAIGGTFKKSKQKLKTDSILRDEIVGCIHVLG